MANITTAEKMVDCCIYIEYFNLTYDHEFMFNSLIEDGKVPVSLVQRIKDQTFINVSEIEFAIWLEDNQTIYESFCSTIEQAKKAKIFETTWGARAAFEITRWENRFVTTKGYALNNNVLGNLSRYYMIKNSDPIFQIRTQKDDLENWDRIYNRMELE